jgi:hypothetical protein
VRQTLSATLYPNGILGVTILLVLLSMLLGGVALGIMALLGRIRRPPIQWQAWIFGAAWMSLVLTGMAGSGAIVRLFAFPAAAVSFAMFALLWRSATPVRTRAAVFYWSGAPLTIWGAFYFSQIVFALNARAIHYPSAKYEPLRPNIAGALLLWFVPALMLSVGLKLTTKFDNLRVAFAAVVLLLLNPTILLIGTLIRLPVSL